MDNFLSSGSDGLQNGDDDGPIWSRRKEPAVDSDLFAALFARALSPRQLDLSLN